jgi:threonine dehydrogenase-like Zn-dependent dehydrogenase
VKAIVFDGTLRFVNDYPVPESGGNEALIRITMAGICNTDIEITNGYLGFQGIMGHEFVGIVEKAPEYAAGLINRRVVGEINCGCGNCDYCKTGMQKHCPSRTTLGIQEKDGVFAEYAVLPVSNLLVVPETVSDEEAVFVEPLAAAYEIQEQIEIKPAYAILVLGDGKLGLLCALVLHLAEADVTLAGRHDTKLNIAGSQQIRTVNTISDEPCKERKYDIVIEATGTPEGFESALRCVKPRGTIVLKSTMASAQTINLAPFVIDEITLIGSRCGPFKAAIHMLGQKGIDVKPLISGIYTIENAQKAFEEARKKENLKILIDFR